MGDVRCDILEGDNMCCIFIRFVDTTYQKITSFRSLEKEQDPQVYQKVTHILFYRVTLPKFPNELSGFFPNLRYIEIFDSKLKSIFAEDLRGFTKLEKLKLDFNEISFLPGDLFQFTPKISQISFASNKIKKINDNIFDNLKHLIRVDLRRNPNIDYNYCKGGQDISILKKIIQEKCKIVESLKTLSMEIVRKSVNDENVDEILIIARHLGMDFLYRSVRSYLELD